MEDKRICKFDTCVYDWYVKNIPECEDCVYYLPYETIDDSKCFTKEENAIK